MPENKKPLKFFGRCQEITFQNGGGFITIAFHEDHLNELLTLLNEKKWVNLKLKQGKNGPFLMLDDWKPKR